MRSCPFFSYLYQMPSHPIMMKSSSLHNCIDLISGWPVMVCLSYESLSFFLQCKSPRHLERLRWLLIRPPSTLYPEATILYSSRGFYGLWSQDSSMIDPKRLKAALESPAFATYRVLPTNKATFAVHPTESATLLFSNGCSPFYIVMFFSNSSPCSDPNNSSRSLKVYYKAFAQFPFLKLGLLSKISGIFLAQSCET